MYGRCTVTMVGGIGTVMLEAWTFVAPPEDEDEDEPPR
jgi:hypothetical protein